MASGGVTNEPIRDCGVDHIRSAVIDGPADHRFRLGSAQMVRGSVNAVFPITYSACFFMY